jgi:hypothetical protein
MYKISTLGKVIEVPEVRVHDSGALLCLNEDRTKTLRIIAAGSWVDALWEEPAPVEDPLVLEAAKKIAQEFTYEYTKYIYQGWTWQYKPEWLTLNKIPLIKNLRMKNYTSLTDTKAFVEHLEAKGIYMPPGGYGALPKWDDVPTYKHDLMDDVF